MAQLTQVAQRRNTIRERLCRSRNWCFTLNNYTEADINNIGDCKYQYIFQEETGKEGTPHLQGLIASPNAISQNTMKKLIPRAHLEVCRNKMASIQYCQKGESRTGKIYCNVESWMNGTKNNTTRSPNQMNLLEYENFINTMVQETLIEDEKEKINWNNILPTIRYEHLYPEI